MRSAHTQGRFDVATVSAAACVVVDDLPTALLQVVILRWLWLR
jgi:hypothetical protein